MTQAKQAADRGQNAVRVTQLRRWTPHFINAKNLKIKSN
ncbi:hypothetical protein ETAE_2955 [Edwardsiella piscicida]|uniref:Uncharacterized protein n=1 Tax=Edwardsiella piscicida TaxID=1263550 RepID=A0AAU8PHM3_EDWPI|nr:hypothetical protein ETAE_2955 [Edwardsiella tarda EIB202]